MKSKAYENEGNEMGEFRIFYIRIKKTSTKLHHILLFAYHAIFWIISYTENLKKKCKLLIYNQCE